MSVSLGRAPCTMQVPFIGLRFVSWVILSMLTPPDFPGSGLTLYSINRLGINITASIDNGTPTTYMLPSPSPSFPYCSNGTFLGECHAYNVPLIDIQGLHTDTPHKLWLNDSNNPDLFFFDYVIINDTASASTSATAHVQSIDM